MEANNAPDRGKINFMDFSRRYLQESDVLSHYPFSSTQIEVRVSDQIPVKIVNSVQIKPSSQNTKRRHAQKNEKEGSEGNLDSKVRAGSIDKFSGQNRPKARMKSALQKRLIDLSRPVMNGSTFDATHLSNFLMHSKFASNFNHSVNSFSNNNSDNINAQSFQKHKNISFSRHEVSANSERAKSLHNPSEAPANHSSVTKSNNLGSSFFRSSARPESVEDRYKLKDFPGNYTTVNILVTGEGQKSELPSEKYFEQRFKPPEKTFDYRKLNVSSSDWSKIQTPAERFSELLETKRNQEAYRAWQDVVRDQHKQYRVHKGGFKSGIMNIDNPLNPETVLYKEECSNLLERQKKREKNINMQREIVKKAYENHHKFTDLQPVSEESKKEKIVPFWTGKTRVPDYTKYSDSKDRLFGSSAREYSLERAEGLRKCEVRDRDFNILSWADNKIDLKKDPGVRKN